MIAFGSGVRHCSARRAACCQRSDDACPGRADSQPFADFDHRLLVLLRGHGLAV
jgi:hypothetical protein